VARILTPYQPRQRYIPKVVKHEENLQRTVCHYLNLQYPRVIYRSDYASGLHLTPNQARIHASMQSGRAFPDLFIYEPKFINGVQYCGLAIELKREGTRIILTTGPRKGHLTSDPHIREQYLLLKELKARGYYATFAVGFDQAVATIDWYFGRKKKSNAELF
jgi:hypothetical protein